MVVATMLQLNIGTCLAAKCKVRDSHLEGGNLFRKSAWVESNPIAIPQTALLKFIRDAPTTLRWFRSNLTQANIEMFHHERPQIECMS